ncbi:linear amide C-N hydrolase [Legionella rowbothamii]|uniref:linear amide C-N hydrolase n=1 Tax=Legionella rowbothamii TaxID=96229 RepID=UPI0010560B21|nr:linear amide C-N hydrolase [Legionella rowbothamii]
MYQRFILGIIQASILGGLVAISSASACTRALYNGADNTVITGRSMDWSEDMGSDIWVLPRGIERNGEAGPDSPRWEAKYGSVVTSVYGIASADGMNEKGLVMNLLYLAESDYGNDSEKNPPLSISLWGQYALDNFATVAEAVQSMQARPFHLLTMSLPNGEQSQLHLSLSDSTGDSAIFEYINGKLVVHHGKEYTVMTNSPTYDQQLALNTYWQSIGGTVFLPGTNRAADRFARTSFLINAVPKSLNKSYIESVPDHSYAYQAVANVLSVLRSVSVPLGITTPNEPNIASTLWRTISDQKNLVYYFDSSTRPNTFWINLNQLNFAKGSPVLKLDLAQGQIYAGDAFSALKPATPFKFISVRN